MSKPKIVVIGYGSQGNIMLSALSKKLDIEIQEAVSIPESMINKIPSSSADMIKLISAEQKLKMESER